MPMWVVWAIVAAAFAAGELATPGLFFLGPVALAALVALALAAVGAGIAVQLIGFIVASVASLGVVRPLARRHLHMPAATRTGAAALIGAKATVVDRVDARGGTVKIAGDVWSARAFMEDQVMEPGARVEVVKIEGATALVYE